MKSMPILTAAEMRICDDYTIQTLGVPSQTLMERAARHAANFLMSRTDLFPVGKIAVLCGGGNNGGDGFAAARFLMDGSLGTRREVVILYAGRLDGDGKPDTARMSAECARQYRLAAEAGVPVFPSSELPSVGPSCTAVVDAVFGIGLDRPVSGDMADLFKAVAASGLPVLAVDIPSGVHADTGAVMGTAIPAVATVTMQALKAGLLLYPGADLCGEIAVCDLGIALSPVEMPFARLADKALLRRVCPPRSRRSHKGTYGRTVLLCGSTGMAGAAVLSARAALRSGAGLVQVVTPEENRVVLQIAVPEAIVTTYDGHTPALGSAASGDVGKSAAPCAAPCASIRTVIREAVRTGDGLVLGCGLGTSDAARTALRAALQSVPRDRTLPVVLDADALNLLAEDETLWDTAGLSRSDERPCRDCTAYTVITPHPAEMARLCGRSVGDILAHLPQAALDFARERGVCVVLKDAHTVVASPSGELFICAAGNAGMAKGGSGDALAGIIGAVLTQNRARLGRPEGVTVAETVAAAVYLHAAAGDAAAGDVARRGEYALLATDTVEALGAVLLNVSDSRTVIRERH